MNKEFIKKIIKAEKLKYEAIKEILPDNLRKRMDSFEKDTLDILRDIALEIMEEEMKDKKQSSKKAAKKIKVDFS